LIASNILLFDFSLTVPIQFCPYSVIQNEKFLFSTAYILTNPLILLE
jgi:hypothetical protein